MKSTNNVRSFLSFYYKMHNFQLREPCQHEKLSIIVFVLLLFGRHSHAHEWEYCFAFTNRDKLSSSLSFFFIFIFSWVSMEAENGTLYSKKSAKASIAPPRFQKDKNRFQIDKRLQFVFGKLDSRSC